MVELENCLADRVSHSRIEVDCTFRPNSRANGIQVVVQYDNVSEVGQLNVTNSEGIVTIELESNDWDVVLVSVFAIGEMGLFDTVEYAKAFTNTGMYMCCLKGQELQYFCGSLTLWDLTL
jgi:hypothetical protein